MSNGQKAWWRQHEFWHERTGTEPPSEEAWNSFDPLYRDAWEVAAGPSQPTELVRELFEWLKITSTLSDYNVDLLMLSMERAHEWLLEQEASDAIN